MEGITETHFFLIGISHKTAEVELREKISFAPENLSTVLKGIYAIPGVSECVVLSTCNRTEIYTVLSQPAEKSHELIEKFVLDKTGQDCSITDCFYHHQGKEVIEHLFMVTCGLDSMILGEPQIFGQVKNAYSVASDNKFTGPALNRLFHHAFQVGKLIRHNTSIGEGAVSVSYAAVELAKKVFGSLDGRSAMLVGAGKIGEICAKRLVNSGVEHLYISNRTALRAADLAEKLSVEMVPFDEITGISSTVDIIITSVASCKPIFNTSDFLSCVEGQSGKRLLLIDLGVPRNIEPDVTDNEHIVLYNIDDLDNVIFDNRDKRKNEIKKAKELIHEEVEEFRSWLVERDVIPVIRSLREKCENIRQEELEKVKNRMDSETFETLDLITRRIVRKLLHNPTITVRAAASDSSRERLIESVHELFIRENESGNK